MNDWPEWFPDACPPAEARDAEGHFYRLVDGVEILESDFWSHEQEYLAGKRPRRSWSSGKLCDFVSCSIFALRSDIEQTRKGVGPLKHKLVALGDITGEGKLLETPTNGNSHHNWWRTQTETAWVNFKVVE